MNDPRGAATRVPAIDVARTVALLAMAVFHLGRDLEIVGLWPPGATFTPAWTWFARAIAGSFVGLAGVSLWLAHGHGLRGRAFLRRLGVLVAAAAGVSLATYLTFPDAWVRFGILHSIAVSSVIGLAALRLPWPAIAAAGVAIVWIGATAEIGALSGARWLWVGLSDRVPPMMDWEPIFPWTGPFLLGLAAAKAADRAGLWARLRRTPPDPAGARPWTGWLSWPGRHSLAIYLIHQPVLFGVALTWARLTG